MEDLSIIHGNQNKGRAINFEIMRNKLMLNFC